MSGAFSFSRCCCDEDAGGFWTLENVLQCQKVSDFLIALAYFSIPLELFYFVSYSTIFPFRWILLQFGAFIVLCGLTHFVTVWTYTPHSFQVMLVLTVLKFLTALVSFATSITLVTLIPQMLQVMVREGLLRKKTRELREEVGMMKRQEETRDHVRMLTQEIRRSLDRHTILYTTLVELSKVLFLENCAVWMPDDEKKGLNLTHFLKRRNGDDCSFISLDDPDVAEIVRDRGVRVLEKDSKLCKGVECGTAAAVRMPMLREANFKGGSQEHVQTRYAVLVMVLPAEESRIWSSYELELVEVVADQVAVALSHASILEDSLITKGKLVEKNLALKRARRKALMLKEARSSFQKAMGLEMAMPLRSVTAVLSVLEKENLRPEQRRVVDAMAKVNLLLTSLLEDSKCVSNLEAGRLEIEFRSFNLHLMLKEVVGMSKLLCACWGLYFDFDVSKEVPDCVIGDEKRILQLVLYMVVNVLSFGDQGTIILRVCTEKGSEGSSDPKYLAWRQTISREFATLRFEVNRKFSNEDSSSFLIHRDKDGSGEVDSRGLNFTICRKLAQLLNGTVSVSPSYSGMHQSMNLTVRLQLKHSEGDIAGQRYMDRETSRCLLQGMSILLADGDSFNQSIIRKLIGNLGGHLTVVSSWYQCLETLRLNENEFRLLLIDLHMLEGNIRELSACIRKLRSGNWLLIVALTSKADGDTRNRCLQNGMNGVICKPVIWQEMEDELNRIIQQGGSGPAPSSL